MVIIAFITKLIASSGLLYGYYHFFLRNRRFHHYNRFYLLAASLVSLIIPLLNIPVNLFDINQQHPVLIRTLKVINANGWETPVTIYANQNQWAGWLTLQNAFFVLYTLGLATGLFVLLRSLAWIGAIKRKYPFEIIDRLKMYYTEEPGTPFSFFRSIFWDKKISLHEARGRQILRHEMFHVKENHSRDVLLMEIICCLAWFNPFYHLIKKEIKAIHEFLADEYAVSAADRYDYAELLVAQAIIQKKVRLANPFFHNQLKRRITMITNSSLIRHGGYLSRIMALPLLFLLISSFAVKLTRLPASIPGVRFNGRTPVVVIDPGHGGIFSGGVSSSGLQEKDINLKIAQKIKSLAAAYNVNVVLTRSTDGTVGNTTDLSQELLNRTELTNRAKPDLFLSIHVNLATDNEPHTGFEAYISGKDDDIKARQLASVLLGEIKTIYAVSETIRQRQEGVAVIDKKPYPAVLIECGFLNNPQDESFITSINNQEKIARKILDGIVKYCNAQQAGTTALFFESESDTLTAAAVSKLKVDDLSSVDEDLHTNIVTIHFKNGDIKYARAGEMRTFYAAHNIADTVPAGHRAAKAVKDSQPTFTKVEFEPDYPGGQAGWIKYLTGHLRYPDAAVKKNIQGTVLMEFIVNTDGTLSDVKALSGPEELKEASIRVIKQSGVWVPAKQNGKTVRAYKKQPITYKLS